MSKQLSYVKKEDRKKILLLSDDIRLHSGIATMAREIVVQTAHHFNWVNLGGAMNHPDDKKAFDLSSDINTQRGIDDGYVKLYATSGYGTADIVRELIKVEKPDAILHFTDPRYWTWLYDIEREVRQQMPLLYLNIWDDYPTPLYNRSFYECCDLLMGISKQTVNINKMVLGEKGKGKVIEYVPHGINEEQFYPIQNDEEYKQLELTRESMFEGKDIDFVVFWNSRNIRRKSPGDVILAYRHFCDLIGEEKAKKCALVMHTSPVDQNGTDLYAVREAICDPEYVNVFFSANKLNTKQMNYLYNIADVTMLISSNEGWGLSLTESMMAGTPIIGNVSGGMQDQMKFIDEDGKWYTPNPEVPSNHMGTYKEHGSWAKPVFPSNISLVGSVPTPYIHDDRCDFRDVAEAIKYWYSMSKEEREEAGKAAREWVTSDEAMMSAIAMGYNVAKYATQAIEEFIPRSRFDLTKVEDLPRNYVKHPMVY
jgi:glycosyltransferase involved in cell wall biosynthesis